MWSILVGLIFVSFAQACVPRNDPTPEISSEEFNDLASQVAKNNFNKFQNNFQEVATLIEEQLDSKHHQANYKWKCNVNFQRFINTGDRNSVLSMFIFEPKTKLSILCNLKKIYKYCEFCYG